MIRELDFEFFIGREEELNLLNRFIEGETQFLTLTGPAGVGKTALILNFLHSLQVDTYYLNLLSIASHETAFERLTSELSLRSNLQSVDDVLGGVKGIVVVDDFDCMLPFTMDWLGPLAGDRNLRFIFVSRRRLGDDALLELKPFSVPDLSDCESNDAFILFLKIVRLHSPQFEPNETEKKNIVELLTTLDGLPLAIARAASGMRVSSVKDMLRELRNDGKSDTFGLSLEDELGLEWEKLNTSEKNTFAFTSIHLQCFDISTHLELLFKWDGIGPELSLKNITTLRDNSLLAQDDNQQLYTYKMVQRFGAKQLVKMGRAKSAKKVFIDHYAEVALNLVEQSDLTGTRRVLSELEQFIGGFESALIYLKEEQSSKEIILSRLWVVRALGKSAANKANSIRIQHLVSAEKKFAERMLSHEDQEIQNYAALTLLILGFLEPNAIRLDLSEICVSLESRELSTEVEARTVVASGRIALGDKQWRRSIELCEKAQKLLRDEEFHALAAAEEITIGISYFQLGNYTASKEHYEKAVYDLDNLKADSLILFALYNLLTLCVTLNEHKRAKEISGRLIAGFRSIGNAFGVAQVQIGLGVMHLHCDELGGAEKMFKSAASILEATGNFAHAAHANCALAETALRIGNEKSAYEHLEISENFTPEDDPHGARIEMCILRALLHERRLDWSGVLFEMNEALSNPDFESFRMKRVQCLAKKAVALFCLGNEEAAREDFDRCLRVAEEIPRTLEVNAVLFLEVVLSLGKEKQWHDAKPILLDVLRGGFGKESIFPVSANGWIRESTRTIWRILDEHQRCDLQSAVLDPQSLAICLSPNIERLRLPGGKWVDVGKHRNGKKLLKLLAERHPEGAQDEFLIRQIWADEKIQPAAAANRLYNAVALLRSAGLKKYLRKTEEKGYFLDDSIRVIYLREIEFDI